MNTSCPNWPQGPWSPLGYRVVEVADDKVPAGEGRPQPRHPAPNKKAPMPPELPQAPGGDRFIELALEEAAGNTAPDAVGPKETRRRLRPPARWGAIAGGVAVLIAVALGLTLHRRSADAAAAAEDGLSDGPAIRETFGTSVGFVRNPAAAARAAVQEQKLLCLLHVSGSFEEAKFT